MSFITEPISYFAEEGKKNLPECLRLAFLTAAQFGLSKVVIFTGIGDGVQEAIEKFLVQPQYEHIIVVAVTFPQGTVVRQDEQQTPHVFPRERQQLFQEKGITLIRAHLPLSPIAMQYQHRGVLAQDLGIVANALNIFCGSMSLCVQAVLVACDAGAIEPGEHVVVMTSDTALLVRAAPTIHLLTEFVVRQIVCKPAFLTISKQERAVSPSEADAATEIVEPARIESRTVDGTS